MPARCPVCGVYGAIVTINEYRCVAFDCRVKLFVGELFSGSKLR
jgi:hypothetical protein